ncbi:MAG TPA: flagellar biosynthetic protein FliO [Marmoricola sp.]|jgi:flagellar protein FliO/FliZ|nr:flagellar biosynthetic protein FliO [Marmoricola sp.]
MLALTVRLIASLMIVVGLLLVLARVGARKFRGNSGALVHVVHRQALSRTSAVTVVTVGSRVLVLGTTEQQVRVLAELDPEELEDAEITDLEEFASLSLVEEPAVVEERAPAGVTKPPRAADRPDRAGRAAHRVSTTSTNGRPGSHRAAPEKPAHAPATGSQAGPLAGSILSPATWRQAFSAATRRAS